MKFLYRSFVFILFLLLSAPEPSNGSEWEEKAKDILQKTGIEGGLIVHVNCGDGKLTSALQISPSFIVHGIDSNPAHVNQAKQYIKSKGQTGTVSIAQLGGKNLPYIDNIVNLLISQDLKNIPLQEVKRVLAPNGVAYFKENGKWTTITKPKPQRIDEWTHYLHGPDNNAVAKDVFVAEPFHMQWYGKPKWARHHNHLASVSAMVSSGGRLFAIVDEGPINSINKPSNWFLLARDAFNGAVLWKKPLGPWEGHLRRFRSGPPELSRRLVASDHRVFVTLGYGQPLTALNAATGKVETTYDNTAGAAEIIHHQGILYLVVGEIDREKYQAALRRGKESPPLRNKQLKAINADTGELIWEKSTQQVNEIFPTTLCVKKENLYFHGKDRIVCLNAKTGEEKWKIPHPSRHLRLGWSTPTLVAYDDLLFCADCAPPSAEEKQPENIKWKVTSRPKRGNDPFGQLIAFSAKNGEELWRCKTSQGYNAPPDVFIADDLVWTSASPKIESEDFTQGRDPLTGEVKRTLKTADAFTTTHHHRCYRNKATDQFIMIGRTGTELIDLQGNPPLRNNWIRGACQYGVLPCNGLLYLPPHSCACYIQSKLSGFWALAPKRQNTIDHTQKIEDRLEKGPAYNQIPKSNTISEHDWPTYRRDALRGSHTQTEISSSIKPVWQNQFDTPITSPVIGGGKVLIASTDTHTIHCMDEKTGKLQWEFTAGGRIDSPPTIYNGAALFGSADGYVYALRLNDGAFIWRFRAAPQDRRTIAANQLESVWPVPGNILIYDDKAYFAAGRSSYLDGGMDWFKLDPRTGKLLAHKNFYSRDPKTGRQPEELVDDVEMPGALPDILSCDGKNIFWRDKRLNINGEELEPNVPHLYSSVGLLDDSWWHRTYWIYGAKVYGRASGWSVVANYVPSGRIMALDDTTVLGYGRKRVGGGDRGFSDVDFHLFRANKKVEPIPGKRLKNNNLALTENFVPTKIQYHWSKDVPLAARAMVLAKDKLIIAGPVSTPGREPVFTKNADAILAMYAKNTGAETQKMELTAQPVFDGMAAANGCLYLSLIDGNVVCLGK